MITIDNPSTRVLSTRRLFEIVQEMCALLRVDMISAIAAKRGIGNMPYGSYSTGSVGGDPWIITGWLDFGDTKDWVPVFVEEEPPNIGVGDPQQQAELQPESNTSLARAGLIRLSDAVEIIQWARSEIWAQYCAKNAGRKKTFRRLSHMARFRYRLGLYATRAEDLAQKSIYRRDRPLVGSQRISTRYPKQRKLKIPIAGDFYYNGTHARRLAVGRVALTEGQWLDRYYKRLAKRKKTSARRPKRKKKGPTVPPLKSGRPRPLRPITIHIDSHRGNTVSGVTGAASTSVRRPDDEILESIEMPDVTWG